MTFCEHQIPCSIQIAKDCLNDVIQCTHFQDKTISFQCCKQTIDALKLFKILVWHAPIATNSFKHAQNFEI